MRSRSILVLVLLSTLTTAGSAQGQIAPTAEQIQEFMQGPADTPVVIVNLLRFKKEASEPDVGMTGEEAYGLYFEQMVRWVESQGGKLIWSGRVDSMAIGNTEEHFDVVALVEYPSRQALLRIAGDPRVTEYAVHRTSGLEMQWAIAATAVSREDFRTTDAGEIRPGVFRTPDERFADLPDFNFEPHYKEVNGYRVHYLDEGPREADPILLLHGEPTWSFLHRKMIPVLTEAGHRCIVPDLIGFGRSDKPAKMETHTYEFHVDAMTKLLQALDLQRVTFFGQDWGGLIGLRVVAENQERFSRVVVSNTGLPTGDREISAAFMRWKQINQGMIDRGDIPTGAMLANNLGAPELQAAYDAPFPDSRYKAGPLIMPQRVPVTADDPARQANLNAWDVFRKWEKPFLTVFGDSDPVTGGLQTRFQDEIPGAKGQPHTIIEGAGHFIQETHGEELARIIVKFIADTRTTD